MSLTRITSARHAEPHGGGMATRLNWLRAAVLGANDGVVSTAGLVVGVAGATASRTAILTAHLAGLFAGALAMASGEYVSVSSQRDAEQAMLALERRELAESPRAEVAELARIYEAKGLQPGLARQVAERLTAHDALAAHAEAELGIDPQQLARPGHAAAASFLSFTAGALLPLLAITLVPGSARIASDGHRRACRPGGDRDCQRRARPRAARSRRRAQRDGRRDRYGRDLRHRRADRSRGYLTTSGNLAGDSCSR